LGADPEVTKGLLGKAGYELVPGESSHEPVKWFLMNAQWETLGTDKDVWAGAQRLTKALSVLTSDEADKLDVVMRQIQETRQDGSGYSSTFIALEGQGALTLTGLAPAVVTTNPQLSPEEKERLRIEEKTNGLAPFLLAALRDPENVQDVLYLRGREPTLARLRYIYEIVRDDIGKIPQDLHRIVPAADLPQMKVDSDRFWISIHHRGVYGHDALHRNLRDRKSKKPVPPPTNPMYLDEATAFVRRLVDYWVQHKAKP
jgi:hypothetical protein